MAKLPKSIIKKYGISKKAWQVFRGQKKGSVGSKRSVKPMGKRRSKARSVVKRSYRKAKSFGGGITGRVLPPVIAGAIRPTVSKWLAPVTSKIPGGAYAEHIAFIGAGVLADNLFKGQGTLKRVIHKSQEGEAYLMGLKLGSGINLGSVGGSSNMGGVIG